MRTKMFDDQRRITETGSTLADVNARIVDAEKRIAVLRAGIPPLPDRREEREDLLAAKELGNATVDDLVAFDKEVFAATKAHETATSKVGKEIASVEGLCAGLKRTASALTRDLDSFRTEHLEHSRALCKAEYEKAGERYVEAARELLRQAVLAVTWSSFGKRLGAENHVGEVIGELNIVPLGCDSTRGVLPATDSASMVAAYDQAEEEVLAGLKAEGVAVPFPATAPPTIVKVRVPGLGEGTPVSVMRPEEPLRFPDGHVAPPQAVTEE